MYDIHDRSLKTKTDTFTSAVTGRSIIAAPGAYLQIQVLSVYVGKSGEATNWPVWIFKSGTTGTEFLRMTAADDGGGGQWQGVFFVEENEALVVTTSGTAAGTISTLTIQYRIASTLVE